MRAERAPWSRIQIVVLALSTFGIIIPTHAGDEYRLTGCSVHEGSITLGFLNESRAIRGVTIGPKGVTMGGNVKGAAPLQSVKQFRFTKTGVLVYESKNGPEVVFGTISQECRMKFQRVVGPLAKIVEGDR